MNTLDTQKQTYETQKMLKREYYNNRYDNEAGFKEKEIERNKILVKNRYHNNPEVKERMKQQALARYYRLKEQTINSQDRI
jgi:hypothetical protein